MSNGPKWSGMIQIFLDHPGAHFTRRQIVKLTGLKGFYVGKYLSIWSRSGIITRDQGAYLLRSESRAISLISRSVDVTMARESSTVPVTKTNPHPHSPIMAGLDFGYCDKLILEYSRAANNPANAHLFRLTGSGDRGRSLMIYGKTLTAKVSLNTFHGSINVHDKDHWREEARQLFGEVLYEQIKGRELTQQIELGLSPLRRRLMKETGLKVKWEVTPSQGSDQLGAAELAGVPESDLNLVMSLYNTNQVAQDFLMAALQREQRALNDKQDIIIQALTANTAALNRLTDTLLKPQDRIEIKTDPGGMFS